MDWKSESDVIAFLTARLGRQWISTSEILGWPEIQHARKANLITTKIKTFFESIPEFELITKGSQMFVRKKRVALAVKSVDDLKRSAASPPRRTGRLVVERPIEVETMDARELVDLTDFFTLESKEKLDKEEIENFFFSPEKLDSDLSFAPALLRREELDCFSSVQAGLLGFSVEECSESFPVFLNTSSPFCMITIGVQGAGKSHTLGTVIENCVLNLPPVVQLEKPVSTLIFHYDSDEGNFCQSVGLGVSRLGLLAVKKVSVLVSPSFYQQRKKFYAGLSNCTVRPLLFRWKSITASILRSLMRIHLDQDPPLYMGALLDLLRKLQKKNTFPTFKSFKDQLSQLDLTSGQTAPLSLRIRLVESLLAESEENEDLEQVNLEDVCAEGSVVICDLTDPMMTSSEARGIFEVLLEKFKVLPMKCGKLIVFDEAHKYMKNDGSGDDLCGNIIESVRQMRHHGLRIIVSSQSPLSLPNELMELVTIFIVHRFHSKDWFIKLKAKIPLADSAFDKIMSLRTGSALLFSSSDSMSLGTYGSGVHEIQIRKRITADTGKSRVVSRSLAQVRDQDVDSYDSASVLEDKIMYPDVQVAEDKDSDALSSLELEFLRFLESKRKQEQSVKSASLIDKPRTTVPTPTASQAKPVETTRPSSSLSEPVETKPKRSKAKVSASSHDWGAENSSDGWGSS